MLKGIDVLVYDIQDIGSRSYLPTSVRWRPRWSGGGEQDRLVVLDRPNPLTGNRIEGRPLDLRYKSFVGTCLFHTSTA